MTRSRRHHGKRRMPPPLPSGPPRTWQAAWRRRCCFGGGSPAWANTHARSGRRRRKALRMNAMRSWRAELKTTTGAAGGVRETRAAALAGNCLRGATALGSLITFQQSCSKSRTLSSMRPPRACQRWRFHGLEINLERLHLQAQVHRYGLGLQT